MVVGWVAGGWVAGGWVGCELGAVVGVDDGACVGVVAGSVGFDDGPGMLAAIVDGPDVGFVLGFGVVAPDGSSA